MLLADTMGQLVNHTSFQFNGTVVETLFGALVGVDIIAFLRLIACSSPGLAVMAAYL